MNTTEKNKLIAEFMGLPKEGKYYGIDSENYCVRLWDRYSTKSISLDDENDFKTYYAFLPEEMQFNSSWDWLMPVVEKFESLGVNFWIVKNKVNVTIVGELAKNLNSLYDTEFEGYDFGHFTGVSKIEAVYNAVVQLIQWYLGEKH